MLPLAFIVFNPVVTVNISHAGIFLLLGALIGRFVWARWADK